MTWSSRAHDERYLEPFFAHPAPQHLYSVNAHTNNTVAVEFNVSHTHLGHIRSDAEHILEEDSYGTQATPTCARRGSVPDKGWQRWLLTGNQHKQLPLINAAPLDVHVITVALTNKVSLGRVAWLACSLR